MNLTRGLTVLLETEGVEGVVARLVAEQRRPRGVRVNPEAVRPAGSRSHYHGQACLQGQIFAL